MGKIELDKYYTPTDLAKHCVEKVKELIGEENITEWLEPSAGSGVFLKYFTKPYLAYDICPENDLVKEKDYLKTPLFYKKGRCIIGNPPFGKGNYTSVKFYKKAITEGDYIAFIQPISQLHNNMYMYEFDMIYSEDLGKKEYSGREIHCCFNIYKRNPNGFNVKPSYDLKDVELRGVARGKSRNDKIPEKYDFSILGLGTPVGKICDYEGQYCQQIYVTVKNKDLKDKVKEVIINTDWQSLYGMTATPKLKHWMIYKRLSECIPNIH